jgi:hypothetical protein
MDELIAELEYDQDQYETDDSYDQVIVKWADGKAYLTQMTPQGYRVTANTIERFVEWED